MAVTYATLTGNVSDILGTALVDTRGKSLMDRVRVTVENNSDDGILLDTLGNRTMVGGIARTPDLAGGVSFELVATDSTDISPVSGRLYRLTIVYPDLSGQVGPRTATSGWFPLADDADLVDVWNLDVTVIADAIDHGDTAGDVTLDGDVYQLHEITMTGDVDITVTGTRRREMALWIEQDAIGGHALTISGAAIVPDGWVMPDGGGDTATITFVRWASGWRAHAGGAAGTAGIGPTTPTSLTATPSVTSVLLAWVASTDDVGVDGYEVRVGTGSWVDVGNVLTYNVTGLTSATAYTFLVRAYDADGHKSSAASVSSTTTVPGWTAVFSDTFTASDGTLLNAHAPNTGSSTAWSTANSAITITGGRAYMGLLDNTTAACSFHDATAAVMRVTVDYDVTEQKVGNLQEISLHFWNGGTRVGGTTSTRNTDHIVRLKKAAYNSSVVAMTAMTPYSGISPNDTLTLTAQGGHDLTAVPLSGTLQVVTHSDETFSVYVDGDLWATGSKLVDGGGGSVTIGTYGAIGFFAGKAHIDNAKIEHQS